MKEMRYSFLFVLVLIVSCKKHHDSPHPVLSPTRTALLAHTWVQDSTASVINGHPGLPVYSSPRLVFTFGLYTYTTAYESKAPYDTSNYELEEPDKIYYWANGDVKDTSRYLIIKSLTDKSFETLLPGNPAAYQWCHAQ